MERMFGHFNATSPYLQDICCKDKENGVRRLKEKHAAEYKRLCGTVGWRDYNVGNLSAMETGDVGVVEVKMKMKMKQIIEEQDAVKMDKDEEKARQLRLSNLETSVISGSVTSVLKPSKKSKVMSSNGKENGLQISNDEVRCAYFFIFFEK